MRLAEVEARARLASHDHGILCTVHAERGVDAVPVAYAIDDEGYVGVPVDLVKPKASTRLQRERNLEADPTGDAARRTLGQRRLVAPVVGACRVAVGGRHTRRQGGRPRPRAGRPVPRSTARQPFARVSVLRVVGIVGWSAGAGDSGG